MPKIQITPHPSREYRASEKGLSRCGNKPLARIVSHATSGGAPRELFFALDHPIGCSGARILGTAAHALKQRGAKKAVISLCLGGGNAVAMAIEAM
ncbi:MAG: hypothetical protein JNG88_03165 [Phycisphaerales bacterium]|nr:hypothetical protein [Phycisphaerales bacterium]